MSQQIHNVPKITTPPNRVFRTTDSTDRKRQVNSSSEVTGEAESIKKALGLVESSSAGGVVERPKKMPRTKTDIELFIVDVKKIIKETEMQQKEIHKWITMGDGKPYSAEPIEDLKAGASLFWEMLFDLPGTNALTFARYSCLLLLCSPPFSWGC